MPLPHIQGLGLRAIKTALSVFLCMTLYWLLGRSSPIYAAVAAVICMRETVETSIVMGKNRLIGTVLGGALGILVLQIHVLQKIQPLYIFVVSLGALLLIYLCNRIKMPDSTAIACVVYLIITINLDGSNQLAYALHRIVDTAAGIGVAVLVNLTFIRPGKRKEPMPPETPRDESLSAGESDAEIPPPVDEAEDEASPETREDVERT